MNQMDELARKMGFNDANHMNAFYAARQRTSLAPGADQTATAGTPAGNAPASSGSLLDRLFSIHPAVMLGHVLSAWNKADGTGN